MDDHGRSCLTDKQREILGMALNPDRVAHRSGDRGKALSYLEAWDVKAHLIRVFGYTGFDSRLLDYRVALDRHYQRINYEGQGSQKREKDRTEMIEVAYSAMVQLTVKCEHGKVIGTYTEAAVGQANVSASSGSWGDAHDNALKQAESDALKRCAINLGTQFGLSLYDNGTTSDVIRGTLLDLPVQQSAEQAQALANGLGVASVPVTPSGEPTNEGAAGDADHPDAVAAGDQSEGSA